MIQNIKEAKKEKQAILTKQEQRRNKLELKIQMIDEQEQSLQKKRDENLIQKKANKARVTSQLEHMQAKNLANRRKMKLESFLVHCNRQD